MRLALATAAFSGFWLLVFLLGVIILVARQSAPAALIGLVAVSFALLSIGFYWTAQLLVAKHRAIRGQPVTLFFGLARLVTWEQNEGLLFLRDKRIAEQLYGPVAGGGLRTIYPFLGEELRERVPLTLQLTWFRDERVLTRESVQLTVKAALWWRVENLEAYFYKIDPEVHAVGDRDGGIPTGGVAVAHPSNRGRLAVAEIWVRTLAESCLRTLISGTSTFLIVSKRAASCLHVEGREEGHQGADDLSPATPEVIAERLKSQLHPKVTGYGLEIDRVEIQEVQLPPKIQEAVDEVWVASTQPTKSGYEAEAVRRRLGALCDLLGKEAVGMGEIVKSLPSGAFIGNPLAPLQALIASLSPGAGSAATGADPALPDATRPKSLGSGGA